MSLNYEQCKETMNNVFGYLDTINLLPYLDSFKCSTVRDMMDKLEKDYPFKDKYSETLFDAIAEDEFVDYFNNFLLALIVA